MKSPSRCSEGLSEVGIAGFEPAASSSRTKRATGLRYIPFKVRAKVIISLHHTYTLTCLSTKP